VSSFTGSGISFGLGGPAGIAAGPDGGMWFTNTGNHSIGRITAAHLP
jgi:streptogramin lyase